MTRPAYDMVVQGMGGIMSVTGHPGTPPTRIGVSIGDIGSGLYTAVGLLSALYHRAMNGDDTKVDIGLLDAQQTGREKGRARVEKKESVSEADPHIKKQKTRTIQEQPDK